MATRKRKPTDRKRPAFKLGATQQEAEENDLKKLKEQALNELEELKKNEKDWYDKELDKNLKNQ